jgi:hypothetical protein
MVHAPRVEAPALVPRAAQELQALAEVRLPLLAAELQAARCGRAGTALGCSGGLGRPWRRLRRCHRGRRGGGGGDGGGARLHRGRNGPSRSQEAAPHRDRRLATPGDQRPGPIAMSGRDRCLVIAKIRSIAGRRTAKHASGLGVHSLVPVRRLASEGRCWGEPRRGVREPLLLPLLLLLWAPRPAPPPRQSTPPACHLKRTRKHLGPKWASAWGPAGGRATSPSHRLPFHCRCGLWMFCGLSPPACPASTNSENIHGMCTKRPGCYKGMPPPQEA